MRLTDICQQWLKTDLNHGDMVVDATLGNGFDALFLAQQIGETGHLYGFDVQPQALAQSHAKLVACATPQQPCFHTFYHTGHQHLASTLPLHCRHRLSAIMFNLGWLPNSDKSIITQASTTISALQQAISWLKVGGKMSIMVYPGHVGGDSEAAQVIHWLTQTCQHALAALHFEIVNVPNKPTAPVLLQVKKCAAYTYDL